MKMNDNTILRIKVPARLYEAVKAQLTLKEAKQNFGTKDMKPVKGQKAAGASSDKPKAAKPSAPKKANAPVRVTPGNAVKADKETGKMGASMTEKKELGLEEMKAIMELLKGQISKMEGHDKKKAPVEEEKEKMEESVDNINEEDYDKLADMKRAGIYSKEEIANYLGLDLERDRERINYWYEKLGSTTPSYAGNRGRSPRRRW